MEVTSTETVINIHDLIDVENPSILERIDVENQCDRLTSSVRKGLERLSPLSPECCIYRVPIRLLHWNKEAYTPRVVSFGPYHHGKEGLEAMEEHKMRYLHDFLKRTKVSIKDFVQHIMKKETKLRNCYAETITLSSDDFVQMILVDAAFILEVFLKENFIFKVEYEHVVKRTWMTPDIMHDMWLLENQLPFFILEDILLEAQITPLDNGEGLSLIKLAHNFFAIMAQLGTSEHDLKKMDASRIKHFPDFLRACHRPTKFLQVRQAPKVINAPKLTKLHQAGVKFKIGSSKNLLDMRFQDGILEIPYLQVGSLTEVIFRNMIAFEQCHFFSDSYITHYAMILNFLIDTSKDVELLIQRGIIKCAESTRASHIINNLSNDTFYISSEFYYSTLCEDLNAYCRNPWHKSKATLKQHYFNTPWAGMSVAAAIIIVVLTLIQTVCSIISL